MNSEENQECKLLGAQRERMSPAESYLGSSWRNMKKKMVTREHRLTTDTNCIAVWAGFKKKRPKLIEAEYQEMYFQL